MPTYRARMMRLLVKHTAGRMYRRAGASVEKLRRLDRVLVRSQRPPKGTEVSPVDVDGIPGEWIQGPGAGRDATLLYLHGGAFVTGSLPTHRELAARVSEVTGARVLTLDFRLAPEHPFPAALEDTLAAYKWLLSQGITPARLVIGGESSGGGLALQALLSMKGAGIPLPAVAFFFSPVTDWVGLDGESYSTRAGLDPLVSLSQCLFTAPLYVGDPRSEDPLLRPTEMDLTGLPPMWIHVGDHEVLLSDSQRLAHRVAEEGVEVEFKVWPGLWHVFQAAARWVPEAGASLEELGMFIRDRLPESATLR